MKRFISWLLVLVLLTLPVFSFASDYSGITIDEYIEKMNLIFLSLSENTKDIFSFSLKTEKNGIITSSASTDDYTAFVMISTYPDSDIMESASLMCLNLEEETYKNNTILIVSFLTATEDIVYGNEILQSYEIYKSLIINASANKDRASVYFRDQYSIDYSEDEDRFFIVISNRDGSK